MSHDDYTPRRGRFETPRQVMLRTLFWLAVILTMAAVAFGGAFHAALTMAGCR